jgi:hypothetical protein
MSSAARQLAWRTANPERSRAIVRKSERKSRREILEHYSGTPPRCVQCGDMRYPCLELDHINGNGAAHRRLLRGLNHRGASTTVYRDIKKRGFPPEFQVLCANCHRLKTFGEYE